MMELLPENLKDQLPKLYEQGEVEDKFVYAKFFFPAGNWTWFVTEGSAEGNDFLFFGYVIGFEGEWGYFSLRELEEVEVKGLTVERDLYFTPDKFSICLAKWKAERGIN
jgi:hypothetical protein